MNYRRIFSLCLVILACVVGFSSVVHAQVSNLLQNAGFETGTLANWTTGSAIASQAQVHSGNWSAKLTNGSVDQSFNTTIGQTYKATAWIKIDSETGSDWGGFVFDVSETRNWIYLNRTPVLLTSSNGSGWFQVALTFKATTTTSHVLAHYQGGPGRQMVVYVDDIQAFVKPAVNTPPTVSITASSQSANALPAAINFSSQANDPDGAVSGYFWDFGDGGKSNDLNPSHTYISNGTFLAKLIVADDDNGLASAQSLITISDPAYPSLTIGPVNQQGPNISVTGTASPGVTKVTWSTDRGLTGTATLANNAWNFNLDLTGFGGKSILLVNGTNASGNTARAETNLIYNPNGGMSITGLTANSAVERYDKFETTFNIQNAVFTNPYFPFEATTSPQGVNVEGIFTSPTGKVLHQPGFYYQPYTRNASNQTLVATGNPVWKVRFAPAEIGNWTYQVQATDASGTTTSSLQPFTVITQTNAQNHGFLHNSLTDSRYFEFDDGTPFIGIGPGPQITDSFSATALDAKFGANGANFSRTWMSGSNIAGSSWVPYTGGLGYDGNVPNSGLTTEEAYGDGLFSLKLAQAGPQCAFYGWNGAKASVKPNTNYRFFVRVKTIGVTGAGGFTFRPDSGWPNTCSFFAGKALTIPYQTGTSDWHTVTGTWNSGSTNQLGLAILTMENTTGGTVYIDEASVREDLGNGQFGPEVLPRSKFNLQNYFSQQPSFDWDFGLDDQARLGMYQKIVIEEKQDYVYNHISPSGFGLAAGGQIENNFGATLRYQQYYWRYLTARYGYSRAVQSWEYVNEDGPGTFVLPQAMASYMDNLDSHKHLQTTSFWACGPGWPECNWVGAGPGTNYPNIDYADAHAYVNSGTATQGTTSWLNTTDPYTGGNMVNDSALYTTAHSLNVRLNNLAGNKPFVMGESGIINGSTIVGQNDTDTKGVWLHQYLWAQVNPGGAYYPGYWWSDNFASHNLYPLFGTFRRFMEGVAGDSINKRLPINNGKYADIQLTLPAGIYGWGQKDTTNGGAYFWAYDKNYTWTTPTGGASLAGKTFSFSGLPAKAYVIEYWDTWAGTVVSQNLNFAGGTMTLTIPSSLTNTDVAVKVIPTSGFPGPITLKTGDYDGNGVVDAADIKYVLGHWFAPYNSLDAGLVFANIGK